MTTFHEAFHSLTDDVASRLTEPKPLPVSAANPERYEVRYAYTEGDMTIWWLLFKVATFADCAKGCTETARKYPGHLVVGFDRLEKRDVVTIHSANREAA